MAVSCVYHLIWVFFLTLPKQGGSWARLCHEEALLQYVVYTGASPCCWGLIPPQREWDQLTGSRGLAVRQGKEMLTLPGSQASVQSCMEVLSPFWILGKIRIVLPSPCCVCYILKFSKHVLLQHVLFFLFLFQLLKSSWSHW